MVRRMFFSRANLRPAATSAALLTFIAYEGRFPSVHGALGPANGLHVLLSQTGLKTETGSLKLD